MTTFKLNNSKLREEANAFLDAYKRIYDNKEILFLNVKKIESNWNDNHVSNFIGQLKSDQNRFLLYSESINEYLKQIKIFSDGIEKVFANFGTQISNAKLNYDSYSYDTTISNLELTLNSFNQSKIRLNNARICGDASSMIYSLKDQLNQTLTTFTDLTSDIKQTKKQIEDEVLNSNLRISKINKNPIIDNEMKFIWDTYSYIKSNEDVFILVQEEATATLNETDVELQKIEAQEILEASMDTNKKDFEMTNPNVNKVNNVESATNPKKIEIDEVKTKTVENAKLEKGEASKVNMESIGSYNKEEATFENNSINANIDTSINTLETDQVELNSTIINNSFDKVNTNLNVENASISSTQVNHNFQSLNMDSIESVEVSSNQPNLEMRKMSDINLDDIKSKTEIDLSIDSI